MKWIPLVQRMAPPAAALCIAACATPRGAAESERVAVQNAGEHAGREPGPTTAHSGSNPAPPAEGAVAATADASGGRLSEYAGETQLLPVPGFGDAVVVVPHGSQRRPVLFATHGAGDSPEWQCDHWGKVARGRFLVVCPRGVALGSGPDPGYFYRNHLELEREVMAALGAARATYGARLENDGGIYSGYSQGATMGALMVVDHGADFPHLLLVEGGSGEWTAARAKRYRATGGRSVALVCGGAGCASRAARSVTLLEKAGVRARMEHAVGGGHTYVGTVGDRATELLDTWLLGE